MQDLTMQNHMETIIETKPERKMSKTYNFSTAARADPERVV